MSNKINETQSSLYLTANRDVSIVITQLLRNLPSTGARVAGTESRAQLHDLKNGKAILCFEPRPGTIDRAQFSLDDKYIVTSHRQERPTGKDTFLFTVWEATTGKPGWSKEMELEWSGFTRDGRAVVFGANATDPAAPAMRAYVLANGATVVPPLSSEAVYYPHSTREPAVTVVGNKLEVRERQTNTLAHLLLRPAPTRQSGLGFGDWYLNNLGLGDRFWFDARGDLYATVETATGWQVNSYWRSGFESIHVPNHTLRGAIPREANTWAHRPGIVTVVPTARIPRSVFRSPVSYEAFDPVTHKSTHVSFERSWFAGASGLNRFLTAGRTLVISDVIRNSQTNILTVIDLETGKRRFVYQCPQTGTFVYFLSPDGTRIAALDLSATRLVYLSAETGEELWSSPLPPEGSWVHDPLFVPDGSRVVLVDDRTGLMRIIDTSNGRLVRQTDNGPRAPNSEYTGSLSRYWSRPLIPQGNRLRWDVGFTPDGRTLCYQVEGVLTLIDASTWTIRHRLGESSAKDAGAIKAKWLPLNSRFVLRALPLGLPMPFEVQKAVPLPADFEVWDMFTAQRWSHFNLRPDRRQESKLLASTRPARFVQCVIADDASRAFVLTSWSIRVIDLRRGREVLAIDLGDGIGERTEISLSPDGWQLTSFTNYTLPHGRVLKRVFDGHPLKDEETAQAKRIETLQSRPASAMIAAKPPPKGEPTTASEFLDLAHSWIGEKKMERVDAIRRAIELDPEFATLRWELATALNGADDTDGALQVYREVVRREPRDLTGHWELAQSLEKRRDFGGAIAAYREFFRNDPARGILGAGYSPFLYMTTPPKRSLVHNGLGYALEQTGNLPGAEAEYRAAVEQDGHDVKSRTDLARCLVRMGKVKEAEQEVKGLMKLHEGEPNKRLIMQSWIRGPSGDQYNTGLNALHEVARSIGEMYLDEHRYSEAAEWSQRAIELFREFYKTAQGYQTAHEYHLNAPLWRAHWKRAVALNWLDRGAEAVTEIDAALRYASPRDKPYFQIMRVRYVAKSGNHRLAAKQVAAELARPVPGPNNWYYWDTALAYALCVRAAKGDTKLQAEYGDRAVAKLKRSFDMGFDDLELIQKDHDLDAIRGRDDFKRLVAELERKVLLLNPPPRRLMELDRKLTAVLAGKERPADDAAELMELARYATHNKRRFAAMAGIFRDSFKAHPDWADAAFPALHNGLKFTNRRYAVGTAAMAAAGKGDEAKLIDEHRAAWRRQARDWMAAELTAWKMRLHAKTPEAAAEVVQLLTSANLTSGWMHLREAASIHGQPAAERASFQQLYADFARLYAQAFGIDSRLAADVQSSHRYQAACTAALGGWGSGTAETAKERAQLRTQTIAWLRRPRVPHQAGGQQQAQ